MDGVKFLLLQHARVHAGDVGGGEVGSFWDRVYGVTDDQLRAHPPGMNSMAWLLWHVARTEDVVVNLVVTAGQPVFDAEWRRRLRIDRADIGTAMTEAEMSELSAGIDLDAARAYRSAVGRRTREVVRAMPASAWDEEVTDADTARAEAAGAFGPSAAWVPGIWQKQSRGVRLGATVLMHTGMHMGEAINVRSRLGAPLGM